MGKSLQPLNAIAVRPPANTPPAAASAAATSAPNEPVTAESLGWQLRAALPPLRLHSVSIYDEQANVLWLSEGALGPDEHNVVVEAIDALGSDTSLNCYESGLEDGRIAIFLPVRSPQGGLVGIGMILADMKSVGDGVVERMLSPQVRTILQKVAVLLRPAQPRAVNGETAAVQILELAPEVSDAPAAKAAPPVPAVAKIASIAPQATPHKSPAPTNRAPAPVLSPQAVDDILEFELTPNLPPSAPSHTQRVPALSSVNAANLSLDFASEQPFQPVAAKSPPTLVAAAPLTAAAPPVVAAAPVIVAAPVLAAAPVVAPAVVPDVPTLSAVPVAAPAATNGASAAVALASAPAGVDDALELRRPSLESAAPPPNIGATTTSKTLGPSATGISKALGTTTGTSKALGATSTSRVLVMPEGANLILEVQPFSKLRAGGRTRRYEVMPRSSQPNRIPPGFDKIALQQLLTWMGANRAAWSLEPTSFTLNLSISTLEDERFPQFVASNLKTHGIAPDNIGFEIAEPLCLQRRAQVERFITLCDKLGCFVIIDDFSLDSSIVSLLRSKALRMVKIDPKLTSVALKDKLAQAMVVAIAQAVKVLGIHCAAKRVESQAQLQWLTAIGCDFAQGSALAQVQAIESIGTTTPTPAAG